MTRGVAVLLVAAASEPVDEEVVEEEVGAVVVVDVALADSALMVDVVEGATEVDSAGDSGAATATLRDCSVVSMASVDKARVERRTGAADRVRRPKEWAGNRVMGKGMQSECRARGRVSAVNMRDRMLARKGCGEMKGELLSCLAGADSCCVTWPCVLLAEWKMSCVGSSWLLLKLPRHNTRADESECTAIWASECSRHR